MKTKIPSEFVSAYRERKMTIYDISKKIGKSPSTVYHALQNEPGVDTGSWRKRNAERNKELIRIYQSDNKTLAEVGGLFGITKERVRQIIEREAPEALRRKSQ